MLPRSAAVEGPDDPIAPPPARAAHEPARAVSPGVRRSAPPPQLLPEISDDEVAVRYALERALRACFDRMMGCDEHMADASEALTQRGAAWFGWMIGAEEAAGAGFAGLADYLHDQLGGAPNARGKAEMQRLQEKLARMETTLAGYGLTGRILLHDGSHLERIAPEGRRFMLDMLPYYFESVDGLKAREAAAGKDVEDQWRGRALSSVGLAAGVLERVRFERAGSGRMRILYEAENTQGFPEDARFEDGRWRIEAPRPPKQNR